MSVRVHLAAAVMALAAGLGAAANGQPASETKPNEVRQHYTKYEHRIAMRDGTRDTDESTDTWDTIDWLVKQTAASACEGSRIPASTSRRA
jgi:predicted acyl esterase